MRLKMNDDPVLDEIHGFPELFAQEHNQDMSAISRAILTFSNTIVIDDKGRFVGFYAPTMKNITTITTTAEAGRIANEKRIHRREHPRAMTQIALLTYSLHSLR